MRGALPQYTFAEKEDKMKLSLGYTTFSSSLQLRRPCLLYKPNIIEIKVYKLVGKWQPFRKFMSLHFNLESQVSLINQKSLESKQLVKWAQIGSFFENVHITKISILPFNSEYHVYLTSSFHLSFFYNSDKNRKGTFDCLFVGV